MKVSNILLILPCLCLFFSCQGKNSSPSSTEAPSNVEITKAKISSPEITEASLLTSLDFKNLQALLERPALSKEGTETIYEFFKESEEDSSEHSLAQSILIKNRSLILDKIVQETLEKNQDSTLSRELILAIGDDSYFTLAKFFQVGTSEDQNTIAQMIREISKEKTSIREVSECGVKEYKQKEDILCGIKSYNKARAQVCGAEQYNSGTDMSCPGAWVETKKEKVSVPCPSDNLIAPSLIQNLKIGGVRNCYETVTTQINHPATCEAERFGVKTWKECEDKSFGVAHYNTCAREEFGVKSFNSCEIRKTRDELEVYIQGRNADINLNGALFLSNQSLLIKQSHSAETLACFIEKYAENLLTQDVMNDLINNFELVTNKTYSRDLAQNCDQVMSKTENIICAEDSKDDMCKTKRSLDAANKYFKENLKEVILLSQDKIAQIDPTIKERLAELCEKLQEYVR